MFGHSILVAPVLEKGINKIDVYLPNANWFDINGNKKLTYNPSTI